MTRVIRTKKPKIAMLIAGLPIVALSAARTSATGGLLTTGPPGLGAAGVLVGLEALAHLVGDRVGAAAGVPHVQLGDQEGAHELAQPEQEPDVHVAEDRGGHEAGG